MERKDVNAGRRRVSERWRRAARLALLVAAIPVGAEPASALRVLVTNDDGIGAEGIAELVERLVANPELDVHVVAPAQNQSGTSDRFSDTPITVTSSETSRGEPGMAVAGFPSDTVLFAVLELGLEPELVVAGINEGQNVADLTLVSGTVGAARTAARFGIPAIAVSQGFATAIDYGEAADATAEIVELFRTSASFRRLLQGASGTPGARILNLNFPTCEQGSLRGLRAVGLGRLRTVVGYQPGTEPGVFVPEIRSEATGSTDCRSTLEDPRTDLDAMNNGFASATPLSPDLEEEAVLGAFARFIDPAEQAPGRSVLARRGGPRSGGPMPIRRGGTRLPSTR
jgi:5'-nucleotidase